MSGRDNKFPVTSGAMGRLMNKIKRTVSEAVSSQKNIFIDCVWNVHLGPRLSEDAFNEHEHWMAPQMIHSQLIFA